MKQENIKVCILGSGTIVPRTDRSSASVLVRAGRANLLLDAGPGSMRRLAEAGVRLSDLDLVFASHLHPDHSAELGPMIFALKYGGFPEPRKPLTFAGARGLRRFLNALGLAWGRWVELSPEMRVLELLNEGADRAEIEGVVLATSPVAHTEESLAVRIEYGGKSVVYSGDTGFCPELVALARKADLLICESALPDEAPVQGHMTPSLAGRVAAEAEVAALILTHIYPETDAVDIVAQCRKTYGGELQVARDLMEVVV